MKNKLSQEYKDDLYEKVLEKKRQRTVRRKKMLSIFIVFVSVVGFTTLGFSLLGQDDYCNFFTSETDNIMIEDEYQYFDDLGIKLEFINIDDNSLTLGINIKYEDIAEYKVDFIDLQVYDFEKNENIVSTNEENCLDKDIKFSKKDFSYKSNSEVLYVISYEFNKIINYKMIGCKLNIINLIERKNITNIIEKKINYKKEISIGE